MTGYIHSIESCGTVDGPGLRYVIFFQGCPMRCKYCHNPDTWELKSGNEMTAAEVLEGFWSNMAFYKGGGVTVTGGEPLMQMEFLTTLFEQLKRQGVHTCIDTSGVNFKPGHPAYRKKLNKLLDVTDLILLDLKHIDPVEHKDLTGHSNKAIFQFLNYLDQRTIPVWIRHVVIPGITYQTQYLDQLGYAIGALRNLKALDVLPYHSMGNIKYEQLGMVYPLADVEDLKKEDAVKAKELIMKGLRRRRLETRNKKK